MKYNVETFHNVDIELTDEQLIKLFEQRFKPFVNEFRIEDGRLQKYQRQAGDIMFDWHDCKNQSNEAFSLLQELHKTLESFKKLMKVSTK